MLPRSRSSSEPTASGTTTTRRRARKQELAVSRVSVSSKNSRGHVLAPGASFHEFCRELSMRYIPILLFLGAGCYSYHPVETPAPASGTTVEADLTTGGSIVLASQIGPGAMSIRGQVLESEADSLLLALRSVLGRNQQETFWRGEHVRIPLITVARVQQRRFALKKTLLFGGTVLGGLFAAVAAFDGSGGGGGGSGRGGGASPQ